MFQQKNRVPLAGAENFGEFPIRDDISTGESGHGYVLRMAVANFLKGVPAVKKMLGKTRFAVLDCDDALPISRWFGADLQKLKLALGSTGIGRHESDFDLCGHPIGRSYFVNRMHPRVCILCLEQTAYCQSHWDISIVTACHLHRNSLTENCPWCGSGLSWNRPSLTLCQCGGDIVLGRQVDACTVLEVALSRWIAWQLTRGDDSIEMGLSAPSGRRENECSLMRLVQPLTLGGGLQMIYALGTAERCDASSSHISLRKKSSMASARDILFHANIMVEKLMASENVEFRKSSLSVVVNLLAESAKANAFPADRSLAHSLIYVLLRQGGRSNWKSRHPQLSQHELF